MTKYRFESVGQALNVLSSHGWDVNSTMVVRGRQGDERHYLMSYSTERISPVFPWLERREDDATRGDSKDLGRRHLAR